MTKPDSAENHFLEAIKYSKDHVNAHYNLGQLYRYGQHVLLLYLEKIFYYSNLTDLKGISHTNYTAHLYNYNNNKTIFTPII